MKVAAVAGNLETDRNLLTVDSSISHPRTGNWDLRQGGCSNKEQAGEELHEMLDSF
jgi:hypothetical protein